MAPGDGGRGRLSFFEFWQTFLLLLLFTLGFGGFRSGGGGLFGVAGEEDVARHKAADVVGVLLELLLDQLLHAFVAVLQVMFACGVVDVEELCFRLAGVGRDIARGNAVRLARQRCEELADGD